MRTKSKTDSSALGDLDQRRHVGQCKEVKGERYLLVSNDKLPHCCKLDNDAG